ncbi:MAG TPA: DNRLRE domain-containing protein, partial [Actinomycetota bacterium]|nr:DNRLRE domain-containing protein [Actinomycetota bacterium]
MNVRLFKRAAIAVATALVAGLVTGAPVVAQDELSESPQDSREELVGRRTQSSKTFRNPDGTVTTRLFSGPVHYRGRDGRWKEIDSSLVAADEPGYALRNAANDFDVLFKEELRDGYVRVSTGGMDFDFSLTGAARAAARRAHSNGLRFGDAYPNVDLDYEVFDSGVKETLVLDNANVPNRYRFVMEASGEGDAYVGRTPEGAWAVFTSRSADPAIVFAAPTVMEGAASPVEDPEPSPSPDPSPSPSAEPSPSAPPESAETDADAEATQQPVESGPSPTPPAPSPAETEATTSPDVPAETSDPGRPSKPESSPSNVDARQMQRAAALDVRELGRNRFEVVLELDPRWLHDPERQFPVLLDPTTLTVQPTADDLSYAWACNSCVGHPDYRIYVGTGYQDVWRAALKFDTSALPVGTVSAAKLSLYHEGSCVSNAPWCTNAAHSIEAYRMTKAWGPSTTVGTLEYQWPPIATYNLAAGATNLWMNWDATGTVQAWVDDPTTNRGILLKRTVETLGSNGAIAPLGHRHWDTYRRPKLDVTYTDLPVTLEVPETWHSNGAELSWTKFSSSAGGTFTGYEIHRSDNRDFRPSADTLLTTISDVNTTRFVDTTAGSSRSYTYRIRTGSISSNGQTGSTPADGMATKVLNGRWYGGDDTYLMYDKNYEVCDSYGEHNRMWVGSTSWSKMRSLVRFPVSDIPPGATVESAKLLLHQEGWLPAAGLKVNVHRATKDWSAGHAWAGCTLPGANWYRYDGVGRWGADGGDFDPAVEASVTTDGSTTPKWDNWDVTPLVQRWVRGEVPNFGMLLKAETEPLAGDLRITYDAADNYFGEHFNPRLEILYRDGSRSVGPSVAIASPGSGETVRGPTPVKVTATDDRKVTKVELLVDGTLSSTDTTAPYEFTWSSNSVANGAHNLTAKAYDDVGNVTTSAAVPVTVANSAVPAAQITQPAGGATVAGSVTVSATASDDVGVSKVEFLFDGYRFGEDLV